MTRTDEMKDLTLLTMITLSNSIVQSLHHFVRLLDNQILRRFIFLMFQINFVWNQNH